MKPEDKKTYSRKIYITLLVLIVLVGAIVLIVMLSSSSATPVVSPIVIVPVPQPTVSEPQSNNSVQRNTEGEGGNNLSNNSYYSNVDNNEVHDPAYSENGQTPDGATAECNDGTYSFSQHRSGTCSDHGGVEEWLND